MVTSQAILFIFVLFVAYCLRFFYLFASLVDLSTCRWFEGGINTESHQSYQYIFTERFAGRILHLESGTFMFEHCHGVIPALLPFGVADSMVSSLDPLLFARQLHAYGRLTLANLMRGVI